MFILLFIHFQTANAQGFAWLATVKKNVTSSNVIIQGVVSDNQGFQYITGTFSGSASFGNTIYTGSNEEIFIAKLDSVGNYIWVETAGGNGIDVGMDIELDGLGGLYVSGVFSGSATFDSITVTSSAQGGFGDNFLAKYDTSANIQWIKTGAQTYQNSPFYRRISASKIKIKNGFVYLLASNILFTSSNLAQRTFDSFLLPDIVFTGPGSSSVGHSFVVKTNFSGVNSWITPVYQTGGILSQSYPLDLAVKSNDNVVLQYNYYDSITIDTVPISGAGSFGIGFQYRGLLICELDTLGKYLNHYSIPNIGGTFTSLNSLGLDVDENDNTYVLSSIGVGPAFPLTIAGTNLSINGDFLLKLNDSLTPVDCSVLTNVASTTNRFTSLEVEGDEVVFGGNLNGNMQVIGTNYNRVKEIIFTSIDTSLTSMNWFTSTTGSSYNIGNAIAYAQGIYDIHLSPDKSIFVSGNLGPTSRVFGSFASGVNTLEDGFVTKIVACSPVSVNISPQNGVICGVGSSLALTASVNQNLSFQWLNNGVVSTNGLTSTFVTSNAGTYSVVVDSLGCQDTSNMVSVTIENNPIVTVPPNTLNTCFTSGPIVVPSGSPLGGVWAGLGMINDSVFNPTITGAVPSILTYTYTNSSGCSDSEIRLINVVQPPVLAVSNALPESCADDLVFPLNAFVTPAGGTYSGPGVVNNSFDPALAGVGTHVIKYFYAVLQGCEDSATFNLVVNASPTISFPSLGDTCQTTFSLPLAQATPVGGVYSGPFVISNNFYPFLSGSGSFPVTYTVSENGCTSEQTQFIQVDPLPTASITNPGDFCISDSKTILNGGMPIGGFYRLNGVLETEINPQILGPGIHVLEYVYSNSCGVAIDSNIFEVFGLPAVNLPALGDLCENASNEPLNLGTPAGGIYSGIGVLNNTFAPAIAGVGSFIISYTFTDVNGCINSDSASLVVNAAPSASASLDSSYCLNEPAFTIPSLPIGGTWSGNGVLNGTFDAGNAGVGNSSLTYIVSNAQSCSDTLIKGIQIKDVPNVTLASFAPVCNSSSGLIPLSGGLPLGGTYGGLGISNGFFNPAATGSGFHSVSYSYTDSLGCAATAVETITVDTSLVIVDFAPLGNICQNADSIILTGGTPAGGVYSGVGVSNGFFYPNLSGVGSFDLSYAYSGVNSCIAIQTALIVIDTVPVVSLNAIADLCVSDTAIALFQGAPLGGTYSGTGVSNGFFNPGIADTGNHVITYMYSYSNGCVSEASITLRVNGLPNVTLAALASICADSGLVNLAGGTPSGGVFSGVGVSNGQFNPTTLGGGQYSVAYTFVDSLGCSNLDTAVLTVNEPVASLTAFPDICSDTTAISLTGGTPVGGVYSGLGVTGSNFDPAVSGLGPVEIYYTNSVNGCNAIDTQTIQVNPIPVLNLGTFAPICNSDTLLLNNALPLGGFYSGVGVSNGAFIASNASIGQNSITYTVNDTNGCSNSESQLITVNASPVLTPVTNATVQFCENLPNDTLGLFQPYGGVYTGSAIVNNIFSPSNALVGNVNVTYTYSDANGCLSSVNTNVTVLSAPIVNVDSILLCDDTAVVVLSGGIPLGGQYTGVGVSSGMFNPTINGLGTTNLIYTYTNLNGCLASDTSFVSVNSLPGISLALDSIWCINAGDINLIGGLPIGGSYSGLGVSGNSLDPTISGLGSTSISYTYTDSNTCSNAIFSVVDVKPAPVISISGDSIICNGEGTNLTSSGASSFQWNTGVAGNTVSISPSIDTDYIVIGTDSNGCNGADSILVRVNELPVIEIFGSDSLCADSTVLIEVTAGFSAYEWSSNETTSAISIGPFNEGDDPLYTVTVTDINGCEAQDSIQMIVIDCAVINGVQDSTCIESTAVIYPNPAQNQFQIKLQNWSADEIQITLISLDGRVISNQQILNSTPTQIVSFDTQTLARGVYLVRIFDEFNNSVTRLVLQ
ncbi:MAG: hypothetical protein ACJAWO_000139 [Halieaceae bacterium]|jgi:hypothetical protein